LLRPLSCEAGSDDDDAPAEGRVVVVAWASLLWGNRGAGDEYRSVELGGREGVCRAVEQRGGVGWGGGEGAHWKMKRAQNMETSSSEKVRA
jgi:hypothetical protein